MRRATLADVATLQAWDLEPHVIVCTTDDPDADSAFDGIDWPHEISTSTPDTFYLVAEVEGRPIGAMQSIDPCAEPTHYWGEIEPGLRALDIWIGDRDALGRGFGTAMMIQAIDASFADPAVNAVVIDPLASNTDAHRFYQRLGFAPEERRRFGEDDCLVHRLTRDAWTRRTAA